MSTVPDADGLLVQLGSTVPGVRGSILASIDGYPIAHRLDGREPGSTAAIIASSCALGLRLAELTGDGAMKEIVVHAESGYLVIYAVGPLGVLTVLTTPAANLALLHLKARDLIPHLEPFVQQRGGSAAPLEVD